MEGAYTPSRKSSTGRKPFDAVLMRLNVCTIAAKKNNEVHFGYMNQISIDKKKLIRGYEFASAEIHDSRILFGIMSDNTSKKRAPSALTAVTRTSCWWKPGAIGVNRPVLIGGNFGNESPLSPILRTGDELQGELNRRKRPRSITPRH